MNFRSVLVLFSLSVPTHVRRPHLSQGHVAYKEAMRAQACKEWGQKAFAFRTTVTLSHVCSSTSTWRQNTRNYAPREGLHLHWSHTPSYKRPKTLSIFMFPRAGDRSRMRPNATDVSISTPPQFNVHKACLCLN